MTNRPRRTRPAFRSAVALMVLPLCSLAAMGVARADGPIGLYLGGAYGQAHIRAQLGGLTLSGAYPIAGEFDATHSAYQAMLGVRVLSFLGAEVTYMDFGQGSAGVCCFAQPFAGQLPQGGPYPSAIQVSQAGEGAFALLYLPVPIIDVYVKAGLSRITTDESATYLLPAVGTCAIGNPNCGFETIRRSVTDNSFAYGAGLQWKLGDWAVRGEYERFSAAGANPTLFSIGMMYWFL